MRASHWKQWKKSYAHSYADVGPLQKRAGERVPSLSLSLTKCLCSAEESRRACPLSLSPSLNVSDIEKGCIHTFLIDRHDGFPKPIRTNK